MTAITTVTLEVSDPAATELFLKELGVHQHVTVRGSEAPTSGFRGYTLSLVVSQPSTVDSLVRSAVEAGATVLKPVAKSFWGYAGVVQAPDGSVWKIATSARKDSGPATREIDDIVLLLGVADVKKSKAFYVEHGLTVARSFGGKYAEFAAAGAGSVKLALYPHRALAKDAGVPAEGSGSHRIVIVGDAAPFADLDGFAWETAA